MRFLISFSATLLFLLATPSAVTANPDGSEEGVPSASINALDASAGDFLDISNAELLAKAREEHISGNYENAAAYYLQALRSNIGDSGTIYNLACCYGLLGNAELAAMYITRAYKAGYDDIDWILQDPDFETVRNGDAFKSAILEINKNIAERNEKYGEVLRVDSSAFFECYVRLPKNFDSVKKYPLVIGLHGYGSNPKRFVQLWDRAGAFEFIYAAPQAPYAMNSESEGGAFSWISWSKQEPPLYLKSLAKSENYVVRTAQKLRSTYNIDRVYLMGFSQGCAMTYSTCLKYPKEFDGLMCFGGWLNAEWVGEEKIAAASNLPVFIAHGTEDKVVEFGEGIRARDELFSAGYQVEFFEFEGEHSIPAEALKAAAEFFGLMHLE